MEDCCFLGALEQANNPTVNTINEMPRTNPLGINPAPISAPSFFLSLSLALDQGLCDPNCIVF